MSWIRRNAFRFVFEADKGTGSGGSTGDGPGKQTDDQNKGKNTDADKENGGDQNGGKKEEKKEDPKDEKKFSQAEIDKAIEDRLKREREKSDREAREKQGEFEKLYGETKPKLERVEGELVTVTKERDEYAKIIDNQLQAQIKDWPKELKDQYDPELPLSKRQKWVEANAPLAKRLNGNGKHVVNGEHGSKGKENNSHPERSYMGSRYQGPANHTKK